MMGKERGKKRDAHDDSLSEEEILSKKNKENENGDVDDSNEAVRAVNGPQNQGGYMNNTPPSLGYYVGVQNAPGISVKQVANPHAYTNGFPQPNANRVHPHSTFHMGEPSELNGGPNVYGTPMRGPHEAYDAANARGMTSAGRAYMQSHPMVSFNYPYEIHVEDGRGVPTPRINGPVNWGVPPQEWLEMEKNRGFGGPMPIVHMGGKMELAEQPEMVSPPGSKSKKSKKPKDERFSWSEEIHQLFVECVETLADMATAKTVMTLMIAKGADPKRLTRIRVANHLQYHYSRKNKLSLSKLSSPSTKANEESTEH